jgi:hypothetical protein
MAASNNAGWIQETKSAAISIRNKPNLWETHDLKAPAIAGLNTEPPDPKKCHMLGRAIPCFGSYMHDLGVKNTEDMSIPVWMSIWTGFWGNDHDITMCSRVHGILVTAYIISGVVNPQNLR